MFVETVFRRYGAELSFWKLELIALPFQVIIGYCVLQIFSNAESLIVGAIIFPFGTMTMRLLTSVFILHETIPLRVALAFACLVLAQLIRVIPMKH